MSLKIKELPETERPYEKLELYGEKTLSNAELLAIIIKSGTREETSVQIAQRILNLNQDPQMGDISFLKEISLEQLKNIKGIGRVKAIQIKAICELAVRMSRPSNYKKIKIYGTDDLAKFLMQELKYEKREYVKIILLDNKGYILKISDIAKGGTNFANVDVKDILNEAIKIKAPKMILVHNHPTGDPTPSRMDVKFTDNLYNLAKLMGVDLLDHIVIANDKYESVYDFIKERADKERKKYKARKENRL